MIMTCELPVNVMAEKIQIAYENGGYFIMFNPSYPNPAYAAELLLRFLFTLSIALLFDFRDTVLDNSQDVKTVANQYPIIAKSLVFIAMTICIIIPFLASGYSIMTAWSCSLSYGATLFVCWATNEHRSENWYATVVNGMLVLLPVLVGLVYYFDWYVPGSSPF